MEHLPSAPRERSSSKLQPFFNTPGKSRENLSDSSLHCAIVINRWSFPIFFSIKSFEDNPSSPPERDWGTRLHATWRLKVNIYTLCCNNLWSYSKDCWCGFECLQPWGKRILMLLASVPFGYKLWENDDLIGHLFLSECVCGGLLLAPRVCSRVWGNVRVSCGAVRCERSCSKVHKEWWRIIQKLSNYLQ